MHSGSYYYAEPMAQLTGRQGRATPYQASCKNRPPLSLHFDI